MRRATRNGVIAVAAASGAMALTSPAHAGSSADGATAGSPGLISGNTVQVPVHVPVEVCGNTVNVVGLLNPASGNACADEGVHRAAGSSSAAHGSRAHGGGKDSPGVLSGNGLQLPVHLPLNISGNTVNVVGVGNAAEGNHSANTSGDRPHHPVHRTPEPPAPAKPRPAPPAAPDDTAASLAHTGTDATLQAAATSAALILTGAAVYRRTRPRTDR